MQTLNSKDTFYFKIYQGKMRLNEYHVTLGNVVIHINIDLKSKLTRNSINRIVKLERALLTFATLLFWRTGSFVLFASEYLVCVFIMQVMIQSQFLPLPCTQRKLTFGFLLHLSMALKCPPPLILQYFIILKQFSFAFKCLFFKICNCTRK